MLDSRLRATKTTGTWARPWLRGTLRILAVVAISVFAFIGIQREQEGNRWFDIFDEAAHFDYVLKLTQGEIPSWGSRYDQRTLLIADCMGNALTDPVLNCDIKERNPAAFPPDGYNYEAQQPPLGYLAFLPGMLLSGDKDPGPALNYVRDTGGALLLITTAALLFVVSTQMRFGFWRTSLLSGIILLAPMSVHAFSTVSNDPATVIATLAFVSLFIAASRREMKAAVLLGALAGAIIGGTKPSAILVPAALLLVLVVLGFIGFLRVDAAPRKSFGSWITETLRRVEVQFSIAAVIVGAVVTLAFSTWQSIRASVPSGEVLYAVMGILPLVDRVQLSTVVSSVANLSNQWLGASNGLISEPQLFVALNGLLLVLLGAAFARSQARQADRTRLFVITWAVVVVVFSIAWPILLLVQGNFNFDTPQRYGLLILPLAGLAAAGALRGPGPTPATAELEGEVGSNDVSGAQVAERSAP